MSNKGEYLERIVEILERSLVHDATATVERNVRLPIIGSPSGATAQCDVVIRFGPPHRQTLTIVEVQDRKSPVGIGEFRNWIGKRNQVGAQHLYCVSKLPFSSSIKELAVLSGHAIKLIRLEKLDDGKIPFDFLNLSQYYFDADILHARKIEVNFPELEAARNIEMISAVHADLKTLETNDYKFSFNKQELFAISSICLRSVSPDQEVVEKEDILEMGYEPALPAYYYFNNDFIQIKLKMAFTWNQKVLEMPAAIWSYTQDSDGELAWLVETQYNSSRGLISTNIPVVKNGKLITISSIHVSLDQPMDIGLQLVNMNYNSGLNSV
jgi:hypothetical protein